MNCQRASVIIAYVMGIVYLAISIFVSIIEVKRTFRPKKQNIKEDKWLNLWSMCSIVLFQTCMIFALLHKTQHICTKTYWMGSIAWISAQYTFTIMQTARLQYTFHTQFRSTPVESLGYPNILFYSIYCFGTLELLSCYLYFPSFAYTVINHGTYGCQMDFQPGFHTAAPIFCS